MNIDFLNKLNPEQKEAAMTIDGPLLIIAGAGSGKTTVLINRLAYMVEMGINPANILLTFTNTAAENMKERASELGNKKCEDVLACTYHSFCAKELRTYAREIGLAPHFSIITPSEVADAIKLIKADLNLSGISGMPNNKTVAEIISKSVNMAISIRTVIMTYFDKYSDYISTIEVLKDAYNAYKRDKNLCDYDDLLIHMDELLNIPRIKHMLSQKYQYVMVDEYQDTNRLQEIIVMKLCRDHKNLCVVGDDYQSIYKFSGSDINNIIEFPKRIGGCKQVSIMTNYRSTKEILNVANNTMDNYADFGYKKQMKDCGKNGTKPYLVLPADTSDEADFIVNKIKQEISIGTSLEDIAVLYRSSFSSTLLEISLSMLNIPFRKLGGLKFLDHVCIQDMLAFLRLMTNPYDELAWYRILDLLPGIGDITAGKIAKNCSEDTYFLLKGYEKRKYFCYLQILKNTIDNTHTVEQDEWFDLLMKTYLHFREEHIRIANVSDEGKRTEMQEELERDILYIEQLKMLSMQYKKISDFLDNISLDASAPKTDEALLTLSTVHSAKGLEWKTVFIMDCIDNIFPKYPEEYRGDEDYYEELRCFYVALTRAKKNLYIIAPKYICFNGKAIEGKPAHFIQYARRLGFFSYKEHQIIEKRVYIYVPYSQKELAKSKGAKWDNEKQSWYYISNGRNDNLFYKWL